MKSQKGRGRYAMNAKELCYIGICSALLTVCSWICVPIGSVSVTLQTLALFVLSGVLGARRALFAVLTWLALGLFGAYMLVRYQRKKDAENAAKDLQTDSVEEGAQEETLTSVEPQA